MSPLATTALGEVAWGLMRTRAVRTWGRGSCYCVALPGAQSFVAPRQPCRVRRPPSPGLLPSDTQTKRGTLPPASASAGAGSCGGL